MVQPELFSQWWVMQEIRMGQQAVQPQALPPQMCGKAGIIHLIGVRQQRAQILHAFGVQHAQAAVICSAILAQEGEQSPIPVRQDLQTVVYAVQFLVYSSGLLVCNTGAKRFGCGLVQQLVDPLEWEQPDQLPGGIIVIFDVQRRSHGDQRRILERGARKQLAHGAVLQMGEEGIVHRYHP